MLLKNLFEEIKRTGQGSTAVVGWGRGMGHKGHMMLASSVITKAKELDGDPYFVVSRTVGKDDPITPEEKLAIYKKVFPEQGHIFQAASDELPDLTRVLSNLNQQGYKNAIVVVGADQVKAFQYLKNYNGKADKAGNVAFNFDSLDVISRQETGDPSASEEGPRATPMRQVLSDLAQFRKENPKYNDIPDAELPFHVWRDAMSPEVSDEEVRDLMMKAKERMSAFSSKKKSSAVGEEAAGVGVIASKKQAKDPRYSMSLTRDVRPGQVQKNLKAFNLADGVAEEKQKGSDGKACWKGYRYTGTKNGKDQCVPVKENDASIRSIQQMLNKKGANLDVDGKLGPLTKKSIEKFLPPAKTGLAPEPSKTTSVQGKKVKAEDASTAMAHTAKSLENPPKIMQHRAKRDQEREQQLKYRDVAKRNESTESKLVPINENIEYKIASLIDKLKNK